MSSTPIPVSPAERLKESSQHLRGSLLDELGTQTPEFSKPATTLLKFHGIYQQTDRDLRKSGTKEHSFMIRIGIPGGQLTADQYLQLDRLADAVGDSTLRITSRQDIQYHRVSKHELQDLLRAMDAVGLSSWAACGDVVRNTTAQASPLRASEQAQILPYLLEISKELKPKSAAYAEVWVDGERAASFEGAEPEIEPLYGETYLPRKFKIGFALEGDNATDVYSNDVGIVPDFSRDGLLQGFTILAGGGMGMSNGVKASHPRLADPVCYVAPEHLTATVKAIVTIHRDFGNRSNRKLARLKYVLDAWGVDKFTEELRLRVEHPLQAPKALTWQSATDPLGWHQQEDGNWFLGLRVVSGRIQDDAQMNLRAALRRIVELFQPEIRLTAQQNLLIAGVAEEYRGAVDLILSDNHVRQAAELPPVLRHSMACPALPTCGQALTEAERVLPQIAEGIQAELDRAGLPREAVQVRVTGCPNGCARPFTAEIGIVGQSVDLYSLYLGGSPVGTRLAYLFAHNLKRSEIPQTLAPIFSRFAKERPSSESFGDWWHRSGSHTMSIEALAKVAEAPEQVVA
ncbi:MAG: NADPH-dependent assimilatory sulfite reductase hemoprotein subunit [Bryobacteraceae bacterium]